MRLKALGRDVLAYAGADLLFRSLQFVILPVYAHNLSVSDFGLLALLQTSTVLLGMLLNLGVNNSVQRFYYDREIPVYSRASVVSSGLSQLIVSLAAGVCVLFALAYSYRVDLKAHYDLPWVLISLGLLTIVPEQIAQYTLDAVRLQFKPLRFVVIAMIKNALGVVLGVWFLLNYHMGVLGIVLGTLLAALVAVPVGLVMIRANLTVHIDFAVAGRIFRFGFPYVLAGAAYWIFGSIDRWMLLEFSDLTQVGLFSVAFKFASILTFVIAAFGQAWSPFAYKLSADVDDYRRFFSQILSSWFFLLVLLALGLSLFAREALMLLTPREYWGAAPILAIGSCGVALQGTTLVTGMGISLEKRTMLLSAAAWIAAITNVLSNLVLIPLLGGVGAAISTLASYAVLTGALLYWSQKLHPIPLEREKLAYCCLLLTAAVALTAVPIGQFSAGALALKLGISALAVAGAFWTGILSPGLYSEIRRRIPIS